MKFIPYICLGDPSLGFSKELVKVLEPYADAFEFGIPFSDPIADGPIIQCASERALKSGMNTDKAFEFIKELRRSGFSKPVYFMTYYNIIFVYGIEQFMKNCKGLVDGLVVPDLPFEEQGELRNACDSHGLSVVQFITPSTKEERVKQILANAKGFVYVVSVAGTTGSRKELPNLRKTAELVKKYTQIPVFVGFGISKPEHVAGAQTQGFDGFIVGSALIDTYAKKVPFDALRDVKEYAKELNASAN